MHGTGSSEGVGSCLECGTSGEYVVDDEIGTKRVNPPSLLELRRGEKCAAHVLFALVAGERDLGDCLARASEQVGLDGEHLRLFFAEAMKGTPRNLFSLVEPALFAPRSSERYRHYDNVRFRRSNIVIGIAQIFGERAREESERAFVAVIFRFMNGGAHRRVREGE